MGFDEIGHCQFHCFPNGCQWNFIRGFMKNPIDETSSMNSIDEIHRWNFINEIPDAPVDEISSKTFRKTMKWAMPNFIKNRYLEDEMEAHRCCSISSKSIRKTMKWETHGYLSISLKTVSKTMKWCDLRIRTSSLNFIISSMKFIDEIMKFHHRLHCLEQKLYALDTHQMLIRNQSIQ